MGNAMKRTRSAEALRRTGEYTITNFYLNKIPSQPEGDFIDNIHEKWWGNYDKLEDHHGYVQWLFPTRTYSQFNDMSPRLTDDDIKSMKADTTVGRRLIQSYKLMLDFYGMKLVDARTGEICRSGEDYKRRYHDTLETRTHNHLRVCRILSCFSVLGFRRYKAPLVHFIQEEAGFREGERLPSSRAMKLSSHALRMFGTYLSEESKEYLMYSGVQLPGDHDDHVLFSFLGTDKEDDMFELPDRGSVLHSTLRPVGGIDLDSSMDSPLAAGKERAPVSDTDDGDGDTEPEDLGLELVTPPMSIIQTVTEPSTDSPVGVPGILDASSPKETEECTVRSEAVQSDCMVGASAGFEHQCSQGTEVIARTQAGGVDDTAKG